MSEPTTGRPATPARGGGKKILGMDRRVVLIVGLAAAGGIAYFLWKRHKQGAAGSAATTSTAATTTYTTDSTNSIAALQTEIEDLEQALAAKGTTATTGTTGAGGTSGTTSTTGTGSGTATGKPGAPRAVKVKSKTSNGFTITWQGPVVKAKVSSYVVEITHQGKKVGGGTRDGSSDHQLSVGGLKAGTSYGIRVAAVNSAGQGAWSSVIYATTDKGGSSGGKKETVNPGGPNMPK